MKCDDYDSPAFMSNNLYLHNAPYSASLATSASASSGSVWSVASSQNSTDTSITAPTSDCDFRPVFPSQLSDTASASALKLDALPSDQRRNPRRTSHSATSRSGCPPQLVRQVDRKVNFVDNLVDSSTQIVEAIWPTSSVVCRNDGGSSMLPLRTFIQETLRRSRTSYSTLQVALYYLILIKPHIPDHDFTMEQPDDSHASRALQCGRRMFLAALILASKYLQDRNYSARAWSRISGLATPEITQNEMAFLLAVNWKIHITEETYNRWTDCVMRFTPPQPPSSPGGVAQQFYERQCDDFRRIILLLTPDLGNLDDLTAYTPVTAKSHDFAVISPRSLLSAQSERPSAFGFEVGDQAKPTPKSLNTPVPLEPLATAVYAAGRLAPALGLLPTPRLTPQSSGFSTPAASAASSLLGNTSMGFALAQASQLNSSQSIDKWPGSRTTSPQGYFTTRRSSLAQSVTSMSTASSPESMVSDSSRTSRSSSVSSASSLVSAPSTKLDVQARCRYAKLCGERLSLRPTVASVPEDYEEPCLVSSPESYSGPVAKELADGSLNMHSAKREPEMDDAARALQELHNCHHSALSQQQPAKTGSKRSRPVSLDNNLHDDVRDILKAQLVREHSWPDTSARPRLSIRTGSDSQQIPLRAAVNDGRKRVCCSTEAFQPYSMSSLHPAMGGVGGPGMWQGILH